MTEDQIATDPGAPAERSVLDRIRIVMSDGRDRTSADIALATDLASSEIAAKSMYWLKGKGEVEVADLGPPKRYRAVAGHPAPAPKPAKPKQQKAKEPPAETTAAVEEPAPDPVQDLRIGADLRESVVYAETWIGDAIRYRIEAGHDDVLKALLRAADAVSDAKIAAGGWL